jgi:predicted TPR repeat methyltransferase
MPNESNEPTAPDAETVEHSVSMEEAIELAQQLHRAGNLIAAEKIYEAILGAQPDHPDVLHFLGVLRHQRGESAEAATLIRRATDLLPDAPGPWNNLGNVMLESGQVDQAIEAYERCLELEPDFADTHCNLGIVYRARKEWDKAEAAYLRAIELRPLFAEAYSNLINLLTATKRVQEAVDYGCKAITLGLTNVSIRTLLGYAHCKLGQFEEAARIYRQWLEDAPGDPVALHHLAACTGENIPLRASDAYVTETFDGFAANFDTHLAGLDYQAPQLIATALKSIAELPSSGLDVLDIGCGTGLCGPLLRPRAARLVGVDLSAGMLDKARQRKCYDALHQAELTTFLSTAKANWDLIVSADTLCYLGDLEPVFAAAKKALRPGGVLAFTVEALEEDDKPFHLLTNGRYAHGLSYLESALARANLDCLQLELVRLRMEGGLPVQGWLVCSRKTKNTSYSD